MKGRIIGYDGETNNIIIHLSLLPNEMILNTDITISVASKLPEQALE